MEAIRAFVGKHVIAVGAGLSIASLAALAVAAVLVLGTVGEQRAGASAGPSPSTLGPSDPPTRESPAPSVRPETPAPSSPTAQPSDSPIWHGYQLRDIETPLFGRVWMRVVVDQLNVREAAGTATAVVGTVPRGGLIQATEVPTYIGQREWVPVVGDGVAGWVATGDAEDRYVQPVATPWLYGPRRDLTGLVGTEAGIVAYGAASDLDVLPYEGSGVRALVFSSSDGSAWREVPDLGGPAAAATAGAGMYVLAIAPSYIEPNVVRFSADGVGWSDRNILSFTAHSAAFGPAGPVVMGGDWEGAVYAATVGTDGVLEEVVLPTAEGMAQMEVEGSDAAYVAFDRFNAPELVVSTDGASWNRVTVPGATAGRHAVRDVELDGPRLIVVVVDTESGATQLVLGGVGPGGQVAWDADRPAPFDSATIDSITLGGGTFLALGWDRDALVPRVWRSTDGLTWTDLRVDPATFGGALGDEPVFALGRWYAATDAIYMSDDGASWAEVYRPPAPAVEHPGCPPADEATMLDVMFLGGLAAGCFGNASLTVTAWITVPEGLGGCCWPSGEPEWLNAPIPTGFLAPGPAGFVGSVGVYPVPDVADEFETPRRSRVTGHFQDPAAQECRRIPQPNYPHQLEARSEVVSECERRFVVDRVEPAN